MKPLTEKEEATCRLKSTIAGAEELKILLDQAIEDLELTDTQIIALCKQLPPGQDLVRLYQVSHRANTTGQNKQPVYSFTIFVKDVIKVTTMTKKKRKGNRTK